nr:glycoside hydrolase family 9 protein [Streptomyces sp. NBC_00857]
MQFSDGDRERSHKRPSECAPAACYIDDIGSYSTNEVAVNWNAPLAWLTQFAAE